MRFSVRNTVFYREFFKTLEDEQAPEAEWSYMKYAIDRALWVQKIITCQLHVIYISLTVSVKLLNVTLDMEEVY
jgi:hypothetical protein